jgi:chromosome segregation ATPase
MAKSSAVNIDERLNQINEELSQILEERIEFLTRTLSETQRFSQKIASTELEIQRNTAQHARLNAEREDLEREVETLGQRVAEATASRDAQQQEKYAKEKEIQRLEWEIADKRKANEEDNGCIKGLEAELDGIEKENKKLKNRVVVLEEGVNRMARIRDDYLAKIAGLDEEMKNVSGSGE